MARAHFIARTSSRPFSAGGPPDFSPFGPHVLLWPDTFGVADGGAVASATDTSGNGRHFTQSTALLRPTYHANDLNGHGTVEHVASSLTVLVGPDISALANGHAFIVPKLNDDPPATDAATGLWKFGATIDSTHFPYTDGTIYDGFGTTARKTVGNPTPSLSAAYRIYETRSAPSDWEAKLDGTSLFSTATNTVGFDPAPQIGQSRNAVYNMNGRWAFFGLFPALSSGDASTVRSSLQSYFAL